MKYSELAKKLETATSETRNLIVRPFRNSDEDGLLELFRDQNTMHMDGDTPILEKNDEFIRRINLIKEVGISASTQTDLYGKPWGFREE